MTPLQAQTLDLAVYRRGVYLRTLFFPAGESIKLGGTHTDLRLGVHRLAATIEGSPPVLRPNIRVGVACKRQRRPEALEHGDCIAVNGWEVRVVGMPKVSTVAHPPLVDVAAPKEGELTAEACLRRLDEEIKTLRAKLVEAEVRAEGEHQRAESLAEKLHAVQQIVSTR